MTGTGTAEHRRPAGAAAPAPPAPLVDIVVPVFVPGPWLAACLDSAVQSTGVQVRLWVVDDDPLNPLNARQVEASWPAATVIPRPTNSGFASACNAGIRAGAAPYVLLLNQDARLEPDYVARLVRRLEADPGLGSVGGKLLRQDEPTIAPDGTIDTCGIEMRRGRRALDIDQGQPDDDQAAQWGDVFGVCAAAALYRRSALDEVAVQGEVFDEFFFMHKEDVDLAWRLRAAGFRAGVDRSAVGYHARGVRGATEVAGSNARSLLDRLRRIVAQERAKPALLRQRAWRNQVLLLVKNEEPEDFVRSFGDLLAYQALQTGISFCLDPAGTIRSRLAIVDDLPTAFAARRERKPRRISLREWLP